MAKTPKFKFPGILSLFSQYTPQWLKDLISKTKGGAEYVEDLIDPQDKARSDLNFGFTELMKDLEGRFDDQLAKNETSLKEAKDKMSKTEELLDEMIQEDKIKDIAQRRFLSELDEDDMTKHAGGGIKFRPPRMHDKGLIKSLLNLGTTMGFSPKELLITFSKAGYEVTDELKKKFGVTDDDLAKESVGLEWLILKDNPNLAKQPYSESKVNKMLSEEFPTIQGDLFKKKTGGLISLIS